MQVEGVKSQMNENIQSVLRNQENVETLLSQTDDMRTEANTFNRTAGAVKKKMWYQNLKLQAIIIVLIIILLLVIIVPLVTRK